MEAASWVPLGLAIRDFYNGKKDAVVNVHIKNRDTEKLYAAYFFREGDEFPQLERRALNLCKGKVLDAGAGAGCHSLVLQGMGLEVTALEISEVSCEIMKLRGVKDVVCDNFYNFQGGSYDTLLLQMNGIGFVETIEGLHEFFRKAKSLIKKDGQILLDSSDLQDNLNSVSRWLYSLGRKYYGEIEYQLEYEGQKGEKYFWLFVDFKTLTETAKAEGWATELIFEQGDGQYLARLYRYS